MLSLLYDHLALAVLLTGIILSSWPLFKSNCTFTGSKVLPVRAQPVESVCKLNRKPVVNMLKRAFHQTYHELKKMEEIKNTNIQLAGLHTLLFRNHKTDSE